MYLNKISLYSALPILVLSALPAMSQDSKVWRVEVPGAKDHTIQLACHLNEEYETQMEWYQRAVARKNAYVAAYPNQKAAYDRNLTELKAAAASLETRAQALSTQNANKYYTLKKTNTSEQEAIASLESEIYETKDLMSYFAGEDQKMDWKDVNLSRLCESGEDLLMSFDSRYRFDGYKSAVLDLPRRFAASKTAGVKALAPKVEEYLALQNSIKDVCSKESVKISGREVSGSKEIFLGRLAVHRIVKSRIAHDLQTIEKAIKEQVKTRRDALYSSQLNQYGANNIRDVAADILFGLSTELSSMPFVQLRGNSKEAMELVELYESIRSKGRNLTVPVAPESYLTGLQKPLKEVCEIVEQLEGESTPVVPSPVEAESAN